MAELYSCWLSLLQLRRYANKVAFQVKFDTAGVHPTSSYAYLVSPVVEIQGGSSYSQLFHHGCKFRSQAVVVMNGLGTCTENNSACQLYEDIGSMPCAFSYPTCISYIPRHVQNVAFPWNVEDAAWIPPMTSLLHLSLFFSFIFLRKAFYSTNNDKTQLN